MKRGATLGFEGGNLTLLLSGYGGADGSAELRVPDNDLQYEGDRTLVRMLPIPATEVQAIRDWLNLNAPSLPLGGSPVMGIGRMQDNESALLVMLRGRPSDEDIRSLHEYLRLWRP